MPIFENVCCCMSLVQGAQVFGCFGVVVSIFEFSRMVLTPTVQESDDFIKCNLMLMHGLLIIATLSLIGATITDNRKLVLPWLIVFCPAILFLNVTVLCSSYDVIGVLSIYQDYHARLFILGNVDGIGIYVWLCIFSYYQSLETIYDCELKVLLEIL